jgi:hypothetical protein
MLSKEDKKWIAEVISKVKSNKDEKPISSKSSITDVKELIRKRQQNAETLSERIELEKLKLKRQLTKPIREARRKLNKQKNDLAKKLIPNEDIRKSMGIAGVTIGKATSAVTKGVAGAAGTLAKGTASAGVGTIKATAGAVKDTVNAVKSSKLGGSAVEALMYSNPITAALYMNKDLLKGVAGGITKGVKGVVGGAGKVLGTGFKAAKQLGGGLWEGTKEVGKGIFETGSYFYEKNKNKYQAKKRALPGQKQSLLPNNKQSLLPAPQNILAPVGGQKQISQNNVKLLLAKDGTNYILTKTAIFMGGKNYLNVTAQPKKTSGGFLPGPSAPALPGPNIPALPAPKLLPGPKSSKKKDDDVIEMTKGINGIYEQTKKSNKLLDKLGKKQLLIAVGVLAAVASIAGLAVLISGFINKIKVPSTPKIDPTKQAESFREQANAPVEQVQNAIQEGINQEAHVGKAEKLNVVTPESWGKIGSVPTPFTSGRQTKSKEGSVYRAPFNMKVIDVIENTKKLGTVNIIAEKVVPFGINHNIEIMNITNPQIFEGDYVSKGDPIGNVGPGGMIQIKDITPEDMDEYVEMINKFANDPNKQIYTITPEQLEKRQKNLERLSAAKGVFKNKTAETDTFWGLNDPLDTQANQYIQSKKIVDVINQATKDNKNGTYIDSPISGKKWIDKKDFPEWLDVHSNLVKQYEDTLPKYNQGNKTVEKAKQQAQKEKQTKQSKETGVVTGGMSNINNTSKPITYHQSTKSGNRWFAPQESTDLNAMYQDKIGITDIN